MGLQVIGAGFGRTGTLSLKTALEQLGFVKCHHMQEVAPRKKQVDAWLAAARGEPASWDDVFEGFAASCDFPSAGFWEELYGYYPDSKVILTVRDEERWYESASETIYAVTQAIPRWLVAVLPRLRRLDEMIRTAVWDRVFDGRFEDRAHALRVFRENSERAKNVVSPDRLLVFEAREGWEPLCAFLGVPVPETPFPHVNEASEMKRTIRVLKVVRWLPLALLGALVAVWIAVGA